MLLRILAIVSIPTTKVKGLVLLAGNVKDFRNIARMLVSEQVVDKIMDTLNDKNLNYKFVGDDIGKFFNNQPNHAKEKKFSANIARNEPMHSNHEDMLSNKGRKQIKNIQVNEDTYETTSEKHRYLIQRKLTTKGKPVQNNNNPTYDVVRPNNKQVKIKPGQNNNGQDFDVVTPSNWKQDKNRPGYNNNGQYLDKQSKNRPDNNNNGQYVEKQSKNRPGNNNNGQYVYKQSKNRPGNDNNGQYVDKVVPNNWKQGKIRPSKPEHQDMDIVRPSNWKDRNAPMKNKNDNLKKAEKPVNKKISSEVLFETIPLGGKTDHFNYDENQENDYVTSNKDNKNTQYNKNKYKQNRDRNVGKTLPRKKQALRPNNNGKFIQITPNYGKIPIIPEPFDKDEPLPMKEKDRKPERLSFGIRNVKINGKIKSN